MKEKKPKKAKKLVRTAAGEVWDDPSLMEWDDNDFRFRLYFNHYNASVQDLLFVDLLFVLLFVYHCC